jgi:hypothetical protein
MTPASLQAQIADASQSLRRCDCGARAVIAYEPGCTRIHCIGCKATKHALPDWQPTEIARQWNERDMPEPD